MARYLRKSKFRKEIRIATYGKPRDASVGLLSPGSGTTVVRISELPRPEIAQHHKS